MYDEVGWFVDDDECVVFVNYVEWYGFWCECELFG